MESTGASGFRTRSVNSDLKNNIRNILVMTLRTPWTTRLVEIIIGRIDIYVVAMDTLLQAKTDSP